METCSLGAETHPFLTHKEIDRCFAFITFDDSDHKVLMSFQKVVKAALKIFTLYILNVLLEILCLLKEYMLINKTNSFFLFWIELYEVRNSNYRYLYVYV